MKLKMKDGKPVIHKVHTSSDPVKSAKGIEFVMSDATPDRYDDVIEAAGWNTKEFDTNPIALFNHDPDFPIGKWTDVKVAGGKLKGFLQMAPRGTSARIDELLNLIDAGILRAVSVGFLPEEYEQIGKGHGTRYKRQKLVETSLVSIPANPNALAVAKSMGVSRETLDVVFGKHAKKDSIVRRGLPGKHADRITTSSTGNNMNLSERIKKAQQRIKSLREKHDAAVESLDDENPDEAIVATIEETATQIGVQEKLLASLQKSEASIAKSITGEDGDDDTNNGGSEPTVRTRKVETNTNVITLPRLNKVFAEAKKQIDNPADILFRAVAMDIRHFGEDRKRPIADVVKGEFGDGDMSVMVRTAMSRFGIAKAVSIPADTTTSGWADTLVQTVIGDFIEALMPLSVYPKLREKGGKFTFGRNGVISLPARNTATTVAGAFVAQGAPIPVRQGAFTPITLTPKKMGVITTMTREITEHSTPQIEAIIRQAMMEDTAVAIDTVLLDATASSTVRPAGLKNGISKINASATASIVGFVADLKALYAALITATNGNVRAPAWIMNPGDVLAASLLQTTVGETPFREELARGTLLGIPVITSTTGLSDMMGIIDAADFLTATGDNPQFSVSDQAVLHMEDTSPAAISTVATPNTVAAPIRSLWQTDTMAIRMIMDINWAKRRSGIFQWTDTMAWN
jgi:HK97 family phage major capsid protein/HK97 family phage prohead protease